MFGLEAIEKFINLFLSSPWMTLLFFFLALIATVLAWFLKGFVSEKGKQVATKNESADSKQNSDKEEIEQAVDDKMVDERPYQKKLKKIKDSQVVSPSTCDKINSLDPFIAMLIVGVLWVFYFKLKGGSKSLNESEKTDQEERKKIDKHQEGNPTICQKVDYRSYNPANSPITITIGNDAKLVGGESVIHSIAPDLLHRIEGCVDGPIFKVENLLIEGFQKEIDRLSEISDRTSDENHWLATTKKQLRYQIEQNLKFEKCIELILTNQTVIKIKKFELDYNIASAIEGIHSHLYEGGLTGYYQWYLNCESNPNLNIPFEVTRDQALRMSEGSFVDGRSLNTNRDDSFPIRYLDGDILFPSALPQILLALIGQSPESEKLSQDMTRWFFRMYKLKS